MDIVDIFELIDEKDPRALEYVATVKDINYQDKNGNTMLHRAAMGENHEVLDYLIAHHANVNIQNKSIFTALVISVYMGDTYAVEKLLKAGTDTELAESNGWTPLVIAVDKNSPQIVQLLADYKANVDVISTKTGEPLILSCIGEHKPLRSIFIKAGANVLAGDSEGLCTVHQILDEADVEMLVLLKEQGFDFNVVLPDGFTPLYQTPLVYAAHSTATHCIQKLLEYKVDIHYQHKNSANCFIGYVSTYLLDDIFYQVIADKDDLSKLKVQLEKYSQYHESLHKKNNNQSRNAQAYLQIMNSIEMHEKLDGQLEDKISSVKKKKI